LAYDISYFDDTWGNNVNCWTIRFTNEELAQGDWSRGPAGTNEISWTLAGSNRMDQKVGALAESWEIPQQGTIIFHIRQGVHWALNPASEASRLVNGREVTVADIVFGLKRVFETPGAYVRLAYPIMSNSAVVTTGPDNTVIVTAALSEWVNLITIVPDFVDFFPPEVIAKYGNLQDWRNSVGTGPFMLTDFVSNSKATFVRNPNYWMKNPCGLGEGDQLPYVDGVKLLIIPDPATAVAAFRSHKLDLLSGLPITTMGTVIDDPSLDITYLRFMTDGCYVLGMRTDMAESPFSKKDVRQALMLAIDQPAVKDKYYSGDAELLVWPIAPPPAEYKDVYVPLEELPANVQALYGPPDVAKSKELLAKAGYPNGFNVSVICYNVPIVIDLMSMWQADLAKVNINMTIDAKDSATWTARFQARNYGAYEFMYVGVSGIGTYQKMLNFKGSNTYNPSYINDPVVNAAWTEMQKYVGIDEAKCFEVNRNLMPYLLEQAYVLPLPNAYLYTAWWPWVKNYHGESSVGYANTYNYAKYVWIYQDLKKSMGH